MPIPARAAALLDVEGVCRHVRDVLFSPSPGDGRVGLEVEVIPMDADTGRILPIEAESARAPSSSRVLEEVAAVEGWSTGRSAVGAPAYTPLRGGMLSYEPGGQIEYSSAPFDSVDALQAEVGRVVGALLRVGEKRGVHFSTRGFAPTGLSEEAELVLHSPRYERMARHYDRIGPWGRRMMLQSAAIHVNVDLGGDPFRRWKVATRAAPYLLATFANSPRAEGRETGHRSWRAAQWRRLDSSRTGLPGAEGDPASGYADFALDARAFLVGLDDQPPQPLRTVAERGLRPAELALHLSTLFPEVRPRGYLEIRSFDALPLRWCTVPAVIVSGLLYDADGLEEADGLLGREDAAPHVLERAGRLGVRDPDLAERARRVFEIGLDGATRLGEQVGPDSLSLAESFASRFVRRGRDPGDEPEVGPGV